MAKQPSADLSSLIPPKARTRGVAKSKSTIRFDADDMAEIDRIQAALQAKGIRVREVTQTVRVALRLALAAKTDAETRDLVDELAERWKRGS